MPDFTHSENIKVVHGLSPQDVNGGKVGDWIKVHADQRLEVVCCAGTLAAAVTITMKQATANDGTGSKALQTARALTFGATDDNTTGVIQVNPQIDLDVANDFIYVAADVANPGGVDYLSITYHLHAARYGAAGMPDPTA